MITGIVAALPEEISTLTSESIGKGDCVFIRPNLLLTRSGIGPENARKATEKLLSKNVNRLISWGCSASLVDQYRPGDLILLDSLVSEKMDKIDINSTWLQHCREILASLSPKILGTLAESHTLISSSLEKNRLHKLKLANALDMESYAIAETAKENNVPMIAIRTIADPVTFDFPEIVEHSLNKEGEVDIKKLLLELVKNPTSIPSLIQLGWYFKLAQKKLSQTSKFLDSIISFDRI